MSTCRSCGRPILFVRLDTGNAMPVDPGRNRLGNVAVRQSRKGGLVGRVITTEDPRTGEEVLMMPHFATCRPRTTKPKPPPGLF